MTIQAFRAVVPSSPTWNSQLLEALQANAQRASAKLVVAFASPRIPLDEVAQLLTETHPTATVLGCSSAGEFTDSGESSGAVTVLVLSGDMEVSGGLGKNLREDVEACVFDACAELHELRDDVPHHTAIMFADGLAFVGEEAALLAAIRLGPNVAIAGASAGDDLALQRTEVSVNGVAASNAVALALISTDTPVSIGVAHGHRPIGTGGTVTRSSGNVVHEIDGKPAWHVYREGTKAAADRAGISDLDFDNPTQFVTYMASYEAGLKIEGGHKVRAALTRNPDDSLNFVCQIPEGTRLAFMGTDKEDQIASAKAAAEMARDGLAGKLAAGVLVFECACRKIVLQEQFEEAVSAIASTFPGVPIAGAETYGEIALHSGSLSAYHNSTTVVVAFGADEYS